MTQRQKGRKEISKESKNGAQGRGTAGAGGLGTQWKLAHFGQLAY